MSVGMMPQEDFVVPVPLPQEEVPVPQRGEVPVPQEGFVLVVNGTVLI